MTTLVALLLSAGLPASTPPVPAPAFSLALAGSRPWLSESPPLLPPRPGQDPVPEAPRWKGSVNVGMSFTSGNSETSATNVAADAEKKGEKNRYSGSLYYNFAEQEDPTTGDSSTTVDKAGIKGQYDRLLTEKSYMLVQSSAERDDLADLDLRLTVGAGYGRQIKETEKVNLKGEAGLSWFKEDFGASPDDDYVAARLASKLAWLFKEGWSFEQTAEAFPSIEDSDDYFLKLDNRLRVQLRDSLFAQLQWVIDYDNTPAAGAERTDNRVLLTLGWGF